MRDKTDLLGLHDTSPLTNNLKALSDSLSKPKPVYTMDGLISENRLAWIKNNISSIWRSRHSPYPTYDMPSVNNGIFKMQEPVSRPVSIAVLADWASDTPESQMIAGQAGIQDYSIHLGDTYYVGNAQEVRENFNTDESGSWPYGTYGSFSLPGNHEMYSGGEGFFNELLPFMGSYDGTNDKPVQPQQASFFCLENDYWRLIGLDTGYDSLTGFFGLTPNTNLDLLQVQKDWLTNIVKPGEDQRGLIILSHHQIFSAFEQEFSNPADFIASLIDPSRRIIWLMGHEHRLSIYGANALKNGAKAYSRCIGNGGMPVELNGEDGGLITPKDADNPGNPVNRNLTLYDQRQREVVNGTVPLGHNGYEILILDDANLTISYFDDNGGSGSGRKIIEEKWRIDTQTGQLTGISIEDLTNTADIPAEQQLTLFGDALMSAVK